MNGKEIDFIAKNVYSNEIFFLAFDLELATNIFVAINNFCNKSSLLKIYIDEIIIFLARKWTYYATKFLTYSKEIIPCKREE